MNLQQKAGGGRTGAEGDAVSSLNCDPARTSQRNGGPARVCAADRRQGEPCSVTHRGTRRGGEKGGQRQTREADSSGLGAECRKDGIITAVCGKKTDFTTSPRDGQAKPRPSAHQVADTTGKNLVTEWRPKSPGPAQEAPSFHQHSYDLRGFLSTKCLCQLPFQKLVSSDSPLKFKAE